jgi:hypothetical protein
MSLYSQCPSGFECALSNVPAMHVCCRRMDAPQPGGSPLPQAQTDVPPPPPYIPPPSSLVTFRPPIDDLGCPLGWSAYEDHRVCLNIFLKLNLKGSSSFLSRHIRHDLSTW